MRRSHGDAGFSLVEVMFAATIMFFVLTALFGLVAVSLRETKTAGTETKATNLANMLIEQARALSYADLGLIGAVSPIPVGKLQSAETTTYEGMTFTIARAVGFADDPADNGPGGDDSPNDYKVLDVTVSWATGRMRFSTRVRDKSQELANPPTVSWVNGAAATPPDKSVIFNPSGTYQAAVWGGDPMQPDQTSGALVWVQAQAQDPDAAGVITRIEYWVDGRPLRNEHAAPLPEYASWTPNTQSWTNPRYPIDTLAVDASSTVYLFADGIRQVKVQAWDNQGARDYRIREFVVDNHPPAWSTDATVAISVPTSNTLRHDGALNVTFTPAVDGSSFVNRYDYTLRTPEGDRNYPFSDLGYGGSLQTTGTSDYDLLPFTFYRVGLLPRSPRGLSGTTTHWTSSLYTAACLEATVTRASNNRVDISGRVSLPRGGSWSSASYTLYRAPSYSGSGDLTGTTQVSPSSFSVSGGWVLWTRNNVEPGVYYQWVVEVTDASGQRRWVRSNVVGKSFVPNPNQQIPLYPLR